MLKQLIVTGMAALSLAGCGAAVTTVVLPASTAGPATAGADTGGGTAFVNQFRKQFPALAEGKTNGQILSDGEADCHDMAAAGKVTTPAMAQRYGLDNSGVDQFTLYNIALLAQFTLCGMQ